MRALALTALAALVLVPAAERGSASPAAPSYRALTREFATFYDETRGLPEDRRVALFRQRFDALFPGFYEPMDGQTEQQFERSVKNAFAGFAALRPRYEQTERDFPGAYK